MAETKIRDMTPQEVEERTEARDLLKRYLGRYTGAKRRLRRLRQREAEVRASIGIGAAASDGMPHGSAPGRTIENQVTHLSTAEERVSTQRKLSADIMTEIVCMIDLLPTESTEREVLELRYLEGRSWNSIETTGGLYLCHTAIFAAHKRGLDMLLEIPAVQTTLSEYRDLLEAEGKLNEKKGEQK